MQKSRKYLLLSVCLFSAVFLSIYINVYSLQNPTSINDSHTNITTGSVSDNEAEMFILEGTTNTRYLGIFKTIDGYSLNRNAFLRSDNTDKLTENDINSFKKVGVKTVIDLRYPNEVEKFPDKLSKVEGIKYYNLTIPVNRRYPLYESYMRALRCKKFIKDIFEAIASSDQGMILFHCTYGKDRTGILAMLLLGLANVSVEDIIKNYCLCYCVSEQTDNLEDIYKYSKEVITKVIYSILKEYKSFHSYLLSCGISEHDLYKIKYRLIVDSKD